MPSDGASGGLALFWRNEVIVHIQNYSSSHIDAFVDGGVDGGGILPVFMVTRKHLDDVISDFNELVGFSEKEGDASRPASQMARFKEVIDVCGLKDLGFIGPRFTWLYQKFDGSQIRERLDWLHVIGWLSFLQQNFITFPL
nr:hypothetical protein CFP56_60442 [Quercus suber]